MAGNRPITGGRKNFSEDGMKWIHFKEGNLKDLYIFTTTNLAKTFKRGNTDEGMMSSIEESNPKGKIIFDIGAYIGVSSLVFSKLTGEKGKVIAFEPNPYNRNRLEKHLKKNSKYGENVAISNIALSDSNGKTKMLLSKDVDTGPSSTSRIEGSHSTIANEELPDGFFELVVENKTLDDYVSETQLIPDIIKADIEGAEHLMLAGATQTLKKHKPTLYIEIHSEYCAMRCSEILASLGYSIYIINEELDNRIMIKAVADDKHQSIGENELLRKLKGDLLNISDITLSQVKRLEESEILLKEVTSLLAITKEIEQLKLREAALETENLNLAKNNAELVKENNAIYSSKRWKYITKLADTKNKLFK